MRRLWRFEGGLRLRGHKTLSNRESVRRLALPDRVFLPLSQHIGAAADPVVAVGDWVDRGQLVAAPTSFVSAAVHASVSGRVVDIGDYVVPHPSAIAEPCIVIETDGEQSWWSGIETTSDPDALSVEQLRQCIRRAGVVGLGGAVFPAAAKLSPPRAIDTLVINGVECEPYITCDDMLMRERSSDVVRGSLLLRRVVAAEQCLIAIEDNKPEALAAMRGAVDSGRRAGWFGPGEVEVVAVPTRFPAGGEKQLIKVLTGREVAAGCLPYEVGAVCVNVGTAGAVFDAVHRARPLVSRIVTVTGAGVREPGNFDVPLGTPVAALLAAAGGTSENNYELVMGGPMMGQVLPGDHVMVVKGSNCILVRRNESASTGPVMPCIRCGACARVCPMQLLPQQLYWHARGRHTERLEPYNLDSCIECGCCTAVCPSNIPLVSYFRFAKSEIRETELKRHRAAESRTRNAARKQRLEVLKREQEARRKQRRSSRGKRRAAAAAEPATGAAVAPQPASNVETT